jgi:CSLREA domain-containing protein
MIVAGNLRSTSTRDDIAGTVTARYSLIGDNTGATITDNGGNQIGTGATPIDGRLAPLVNNGGPTSTHAFLPGSPAVDAGDPVFSPPPTNDQRGMPFARVADGDGVGGARIDVGAYEQQTTAAVSIIVDTLADENDGNSSTGDLSLREAISVANNSVGLDTITFAASLTSGGPATILLTLGELVVFDSLTIQGPGAHLLTIDASGNDPTPTTNDSLGTRVFAVDDGSVTTMIEVAIIGLTLTGGDAPTFGGGIFNSEHLILANSTISGNSVGFRLGEEYAPHGGGIFNRGNMTIDGSTISGNNARSVGGGIQNDSNLTIVGSTISGNFAGLEFSQPQAGVEPYGGGIFNSGSLTVRHSTITANNASTFPASLGTGEGIFNHFVGDLTLDHTIVAGNDPGHAGGSNIAGRGLVFANFSIIGGSIGLGPLADNGGPTFTHALLPGSPAIDVGDPNFDPADPDGDPLTDDAVPYDQRGAPFVRVAGGRIDIGAYERQTVADLNLVVDTTADEEDGDYSPGNLSLREAIDLANGFVGADTITFAAALSGATITLRGTELELAIGEALVIDARPLDANVIIDANELSRIFHITAFTGDFTLGGLTLTGGRMGSAGGAIRSFTFGNLTLDQSTVSGNSTTGNGASGGGIDAFGALTLVQSTVRGNSTAGDNAYGGGISARTATLIQSTISGNSTAGDNAPGGGISAGTVMVTQSTVSGNSTAGDNAHGGGISAGTVTLTQSTVTENHALDGSSLGGGVFQVNFGNNFPFTISGSIVAGNTALAGGPDLVPDPQSTLTVNYSLIGTGIVPTAGGNNVATNNPQLAPLANNGGPTLTHALLAGSPAIDAGDPNFDPADPDGDPQTDDAAPYDQRGDPYTRVFDGDGAGSARIDTGAFELIADDALHALFGDYNGNGVVDAADYTKWRDTLGQLGVDPYSGADGNGDGMIGPEDRQVWVDHFGQSVPPLGAGSGQQFVAPPAAASFASAATPNQGGKAEGGRGKEETSARGAVPFAVSLSINPTARVFAVRPRPDAAVRLSAVARTDAGLLAWLASRDDARRAMDSADGEDAIADRSGDARSESGLDLLDGVFRALLGGAV